MACPSNRCFRRGIRSRGVLDLLWRLDVNRHQHWNDSLMRTASLPGGERDERRTGGADGCHFGRGGVRRQCLPDLRHHHRFRAHPRCANRRSRAKSAQVRAPRRGRGARFLCGARWLGFGGRRRSGTSRLPARIANGGGTRAHGRASLSPASSAGRTSLRDPCRGRHRSDLGALGTLRASLHRFRKFQCQRHRAGGFGTRSGCFHLYAFPDGNGGEHRGRGHLGKSRRVRAKTNRVTTRGRVVDLRNGLRGGRAHDSQRGRDPYRRSVHARDRPTFRNISIPSRQFARCNRVQLPVQSSLLRAGDPRREHQRIGSRFRDASCLALRDRVQ